MVAIALVGLVIIGIVAVFFLLPSVGQRNNIVVKFYNENQEQVGQSSALPLSPVTIGGVEVAFFSVQINFYTDDPAIDGLDWGINLKVYSVLSDEIPPREAVYFDDVLWTTGIDDADWETQNGGRGGWFGSPLFEMQDYLGNMPNDQGFSMEFSGNYRFWTQGEEQVSVTPVFEGVLSTVRVTGHHGSYTYTAWIDTSW